MRKCAVIIPIYKLPLDRDEHFSYLNTLEILRNRNDTFIVCPKKIVDSLVEFTRNDNIKIKEFPNFYFKSVDRYNHLLKSLYFYKSFDNYRFILIVQTDVILLRDDLDFWCSLNYSYIGAPWLTDLWRSGENDVLSPWKVGNGGFSLRKTQDFIDFFSKIRYTPHIKPIRGSNPIIRIAKFLKYKFLFALNLPFLYPRLNEDIYWGIIVPKYYSKFKIAPIDLAMKFSFDDHPRKRYILNNKELPMGVHGWKRYDEEFWKDILGLEFFENY